MVSEKLVRDIMRPVGHYPLIDESERIDRALGILAAAQEEGARSLLIVVGICESEEKVIKGYVTPSEVVFGIALRFLKGTANGGTVFWNGQLENECSDALQRRVGEIATPFATCFGGTEGLMEDTCKKAAVKKVESFMTTPTEGEYIERNATLDEAIHQLVMGNHQSLLVTDRGKGYCRNFETDGRLRRGLRCGRGVQAVASGLAFEKNYL